MLAYPLHWALARPPTFLRPGIGLQAIVRRVLGLGDFYSYVTYEGFCPAFCWILSEGREVSRVFEVGCAVLC